MSTAAEGSGANPPLAVTFLMFFNGAKVNESDFLLDAFRAKLSTVLAKVAGLRDILFSGKSNYNDLIVIP